MVIFPSKLLVYRLPSHLQTPQNLRTACPPTHVAMPVILGCLMSPVNGRSVATGPNMAKPETPETM